MTLAWTWFWSVLSCVVALVVLGGMTTLLDLGWTPFWEVIIMFGGIAVVIGIPVVGIGLSVDAYQAREHAGQVCVHSETYTTDILVGKVIVPATGTQCTVWAPRPTQP